ncbi:MAG: 3-deoxy-7-phosphoheptulonate synthase [Chloroflexi bacterium]|nr:3-deoxy-7-phosphoheptulonate synthase [Chloroflexota bacterium]MDA8188117.1 3-deoxy-7-phosphoheptulonate synthase [Dehalococcoidales bacterium]
MATVLAHSDSPAANAQTNSKSTPATLPPYRLASRLLHPHDTVIDVKGTEIGGRSIVLMAGPCAVESEEQMLLTARGAKSAGASVLRGGAFKPRTSPYDFQGLGEDGLKLLAKASAATGLLVITEVMSEQDLPIVGEYADILQIGSRSMSHFRLLEAVAARGKPVLLKRGFQATIKEWLLSAEYLMAHGNDQVILCERGIRTFDTEHTRNTLDLSAVPVLKRETHLPVIVDPSHATGRRDLILPMSMAAIAAGADGLLIEVHPSPDSALCDGKQSITPEELEQLVAALQPLASACQRTIGTMAA